MAMDCAVWKTRWISIMCFAIIWTFFRIFFITYHTQEGTTTYLANTPTGGLFKNYNKKHDFISEKEKLCPKGTVAIGVAFTTRGLQEYTKDYLINNTPLFREMLPSVCETLSKGFCYRIYFGLDYDDSVLTKGRTIFTSTLDETISKYCFLPIDYWLYSCDYTMKPAWVQNDILMQAYRDNFDYFYIANDDTIFVTGQWTEAFISSLNKMKPRNVGVVGPTHYGGNEKILTYPFVHRTHMDIFGFFYPREFPDWFADDWITHVYEPNNLMKLPNIVLVHTKHNGTRYSMHLKAKRHLKDVLIKSKLFMMGYLKGAKMLQQR